MGNKLAPQEMMWLVIRCLVIALGIWGIATYPQAESNIDVVGGIAIAVILGIFFAAWLFAASRKLPLDGRTAFSLTAPFFPMRTYPLRFWFLSGIISVAGGLAATFLALTRGAPVTGFSLVFLVLGLLILATVVTARSILLRR